MRNDNWYTDFLELDCVTLDLENFIKKWSTENNFNFDKKMSFINVPKNDLWSIGETGSSKENHKDFWSVKENETFKLRKISKVSIESQVYAMSLLMNLAEIVENRQKKIHVDSLKSLNNRVFSYGNRLDCHWEFNGDRYISFFKTGSKYIYEKYYKNYQLFLKRPNDICEYYYHGLDLSKKLVIISLDLTDFYDSIDLKILYRNLSEITKSYLGSNYFEEVWKKILYWKDEKNIEFNGLPQGLAASGFFANAFLLNFDEKIGEQIQFPKSKNNPIDVNFVIRDYCRYVDDIRFVVEVDKDLSKKEIETKIYKKVESIIEKYYKNDKLKLNYKKTKISDYLEVNTYPISKDLLSRRILLSGTPSVRDLKDNIDTFKHLLMLDEIEQNTLNNDFMGINNIYKRNFDLKDATVKRFIATELKKNFEAKKTFNNSKLDLASNEYYREQDYISRLLISNWLKNPASMHLLKCGLDIYTSVEIMKPILDLLLVKINEGKIDVKEYNEDVTREEYEYYTALYVTSQILFYSVTNIKEIDGNVYRIKQYKEYLISFTEKVISHHKENKNLPWYVLQAAILFLASEKRKIDLENVNDEKLVKYILIGKFSEYYTVVKSSEISYTEMLALAIINLQMHGEREKFASWYLNFISEIQSDKSNEQKNDIESKMNYSIFNYDKDLLKFIIEYDDLTGKKLIEKEKFKKYFEVEKGKSFEYRDNQEISLLKIIMSIENPFKYENALLLLLSNLLKEEHFKYLKNPFFLNNIIVMCENWREIQNPEYYEKEGFFKLKFNFKNVESRNGNLLNDFPFWLKHMDLFEDWLENEISANLDEETFIEVKHLMDKYISELNSNIEKSKIYCDERKVLYSIGKILKCSIIGDYDYTSTVNNYTKNKFFYIGIKSTIFTRCFSLNITLNALTKGESPISPWLLDVIFNNLRWPYAYKTTKNDIFFTYKGLKRKVREIIEYQRTIYGSMSQMPIHVYPIQNGTLIKKDTIRVAAVQTLMPFLADFDAKNPLYWSDEYRDKHRRHVINLCNLIDKHLKAQNINNSKDLKVDLIIFPELSIHKEDIDLLVKLSKVTNASIFAGLTFVEHPDNNEEIVNRAIWILNETNEDGNQLIKKVYQGKFNVTDGEDRWGISKYRPFQTVIDFKLKNNISWKVSGTICYDATDIKLAADLKDLTDTFVIAAMNRDIQTFDNMAAALSYHMYQPVIIVNTGEFGGSTAQAPYSGHDKLIAHLHGNKQLGISIFDISPNDFKDIKEQKISKKRKTPPANYPGRTEI